MFLRRNNPMYQYMVGADHQESSLAEKALGVVVDTKWSISQWHALATKKSSCILGCTGTVASKSREVILLLCSALLRPLCS